MNSQDEPDEENKLPELIKLLTHDIRNALAVMSTNLGFIGGSSGKRVESQEIQESLLDSRLACTILDRMTSNLEVLAHHRLKNSATHFSELSSIDLHSIIDGVVYRNREAATLRQLEIVSWVDEAARYAFAETYAVQCVLDNFLSNSIHFAPDKSTIKIFATPGQQANTCEIVVLDQGPIVPTEWCTRLLSIEGQLHSKNKLELRYSRGFSLYAASLAAAETQGQMIISERELQNAFVLVLKKKN